MAMKYYIGDIIDIEYQNQKVKAKIIDVEENNNRYIINLLINNKKVSFQAKELELKVIDLDEMGIELKKY